MLMVNSIKNYTNLVKLIVKRFLVVRGFEEKERKRHFDYRFAVTYFLPFCVIEINDKEIKITENTAKRQENDYNYRLEYHPIGEKTFVVVAREQPGATDTPLDIMKRLITRQSERIQSGELVRTRCLPHNGGKQL